MKPFRKIVQILIALTFIVGLLGPAALPVSTGLTKAHPLLVQLAAEEPDQRVSVIVQKSTSGVDLEARVARLGGEVTKDLHIINAFAAELEAQAALALAQDPGVRWMSLDAPVFETGNGPQRFYLKSAPSPATGDTNAQPLLVMNGTIPVAETLYNYDLDRDGSPGLTILPGGTNSAGGPYLDDPHKFQRWRLSEPMTKDVIISGKVDLPLWAAVKDFTSGVRGVIYFYLYDNDGSTSTLIGSGFLDEVDWQIGMYGFVDKNISINNVNYLLPAGHYLEVIITVGQNSDEPMWLAYDTVSYPSALEIPRGDWSSVFIKAIGADNLWSQGFDGTGITVAVVDSGISQSTSGGGWKDSDFLSTGRGKSTSRVLGDVLFNSATNNTMDNYGHGTHIAGTIGGNGKMSNGEYMGVAPGVNLVNVKVSDDQGAGTESDVVSGLQWVLDNKDAYNIRVVNVSLNTSVPQSYHTSPLDAAVEILWFNGIVVVVSSGNNGSGEDNGILYPPANDPFVITVGAVDDRQTANQTDDILASFSAFGVTDDGFAKPDLVSPGTNIIAVLSWNGAKLVRGHPDHRIEKDYFRMSGTSMAAAVTSGAIALLLQDEPGLNPDQVKYRLMATARPFSQPGAGAGYLDIYAAVHGNTSESANTGITASQLLWTGNDPITWGSVAWNSVAWNSVAWNSVAWNSVAWNSVAWNSVAWND